MYEYAGNNDWVMVSNVKAKTIRTACIIVSLLRFNFCIRLQRSNDFGDTFNVSTTTSFYYEFYLSI